MPTFESKRGRPPKFNRPARQITLTLPDDVIARLGDVDADIGRAVVRLAMAARPLTEASGVELATFGSRAVIVVTPTKVLSQMPGVELVPLSDGRALIALEDGTNESHFELAVRDRLDSPVNNDDAAVLRALALLLREARRHGTLTLRRIMVLHRAKRMSGSRRSSLKGVPALPR